MALPEVFWDGQPGSCHQAEDKRAKLNARERDLIGECLRQMYAELKSEPLPPRILEVLERLALSEAE
jgi:Anti-sigma factor NepR